jgi:hypothetical protein
VKKCLFEGDSGCAVGGDEYAVHFCGEGYLDVGGDVGGRGEVGAVVGAVGEKN